MVYVSLHTIMFRWPYICVRRVPATVISSLHHIILSCGIFVSSTDISIGISTNLQHVLRVALLIYLFFFYWRCRFKCRQGREGLWFHTVERAPSGGHGRSTDHDLKQVTLPSNHQVGTLLYLGTCFVRCFIGCTGVGV